MKPVGLDTDLERIVDDEPLMLLNLRLLGLKGIRYIRQIVASPKSIITTKAGTGPK